MLLIIAECAIAVRGGRPGRPHLQPIPVQRVFQMVGVDVMDLPKTEQGNKLVQDFLSKWPRSEDGEDCEVVGGRACGILWGAGGFLVGLQNKFAVQLDEGCVCFVGV